MKKFFNFFRSKEDFNYQQLSCNVNVLKLIQVGFTLVNAQGQLPPNNDVWQFNFHFSLGDDMYSAESIELLRAAGFDFNKHQVCFLIYIFNIMLAIN